jgi:hypothetical protein
LKTAALKAAPARRQRETDTAKTQKRLDGLIDISPSVRQTSNSSIGAAFKAKTARNPHQRSGLLVATRGCVAE